MLKRRNSVYGQNVAEQDGFWRMLAPSVLGIIISALCMVGLTMAWFSSGVETNTESVYTTWFQGDVSSVTKTSRSSTKIKEIGGWYNLEEGSYAVELSGLNPSDGVSPGNGYAKIFMKVANENESLVGVTKTITYTSPSYDSVKFNIQAKSSCMMRIEFHWGEAVNSTIEDSVDLGAAAATITFPDPYTAALINAEELLSGTTSTEPGTDTYTVQSDETLSSIAEKLGTTTEKLAAYNNITNHDHVEAGQTLKIPPKDYEIPGKTEPEGESAPAEPVTEMPETAPQPETTAGTTASTEPPAATESPKPTEPAATEAGPQETEPKPVETEPAETTDASESESESSEPQPASEDEPDESTTASETTEDQPRE